MPFIGNQPAEAFSSFQKQDFTTSATTSYTLDHPVANENEIALFINFVRQEPTAAYTASGTSLTLTSATSSSDDMYCVYLGKAVQTVNPPNSSVGSSQVSADLITGQTALASEPADTDEFLVSDAGTLKRIDYSLIKGGGITNSQIWLLTADTAMTGSSSFADITANISEGTSIPGYGRIGDAMSVSSGVFTFPTTGIWTVEGIFNTVGAEGYAQYQIRVTTNNSTYNTAALSSEENDNQEYSMLSVKAQVDVTDTSNVKVKFRQSGTISGNAIRGTSSYMRTGFIFTRLGDT
jgi:hypothetical protein